MHQIQHRKTWRKWTQREKKILLKAMKEVGHFHIGKIAEVLPLKNKCLISRYLRDKKRTVSLKLNKKCSETQRKLQKMHQWISLLCLNSDTGLVLHKNLSAFILIIIEKYSQELCRFVSTSEALNFKLACRFISKSLHNISLNSTDDNDVIKALLFSSFSQFLDEIRNEKNAVDEMFHAVVIRVLNQQNNPTESTVSLFG